MRDCDATKMDDFSQQQLQNAIENTDTIPEIYEKVKNNIHAFDEIQDVLPGAQFDEHYVFVDKKNVKFSLKPLIVDFKRLLLCETSLGPDASKTQLIKGVIKLCFRHAHILLQLK